MTEALGSVPYIIAIVVAIGIAIFPAVMIFRLAMGFIKGDKDGKSKPDEINPDSCDDTGQETDWL